MSDLISRQAAIDAFWELNIELRPSCIDAIIDMLKALPSAQPEIIRCEDCKYVGVDATCCIVCNRAGMGLKPYHVYPDDFCSYAERRTDA